MDQNESVEFEEWHGVFQPFLAELAEAVAERPSRTEAVSIYSWPKIAEAPSELRELLKHAPLSPISMEIGTSRLRTY